MGDLETLAKARNELEDLYLGVADDSVNLTFEDLSEVRPHTLSSNKKIMSDHIAISKTEKPLPSPALTKFPSLDFSRAFENFENTVIENHHHINNHQNHHHINNHHHPQNHVHHVLQENAMLHGHSTHHHAVLHGHSTHHHAVLHGHSGHHHATHGHGHSGHHHAILVDGHHNYRGRRAGIPHSNICTLCSTYIYLFRHRCLVCGRVYCRQCVGIGMRDMPEGRKCIECLGKRFSQRYIKRAGEMGCCMGYQSRVKQQELIWAEKGPRRVVEGRSSMMSTSRSTAPISQVMAHSPPSFMMASPYSSAHHPLPL